MQSHFLLPPDIEKLIQDGSRIDVRKCVLQLLPTTTISFMHLLMSLYFPDRVKHYKKMDSSNNLNPIQNNIRILQIKIIARVSLYCIFYLSIFLFVALKISLLFGLVAIALFLLLLLFFAIPAYRTRVGLGRNFCVDVLRMASPLSGMLHAISGSNSNDEIRVNIYAFDSKFRLVLNGTTSVPKEVEDECNSISDKLSQILYEYDAKQNGRIYVNFDGLLVGLIALLLLDRDIYNVKVSIRLSVQGYNGHFSFTGVEKKSAIREIKNSLIYQSL